VTYHKYLRWRFRLQELNAKLGPLEEEPMPAWLDHYPEPGDDRPGITAQRTTAPDSPARTPRPAPPAPRNGQRRQPPPVWQT